MSIELERLLKMDEQHLHELFGTETDNEPSGSAEYKYLQERISEYIKRLKARGTTRRSLHEEYLRDTVPKVTAIVHSACISDVKRK